MVMELFSQVSSAKDFTYQECKIYMTKSGKQFCEANSRAILLQFHNIFFRQTVYKVAPKIIFANEC